MHLVPALRRKAVSVQMKAIRVRYRTRSRWFYVDFLVLSTCFVMVNLFVLQGPSHTRALTSGRLTVEIGEPVSFFAIPRPQLTAAFRRSSELVLGSWLSLPASRVFLFGQRGQFDPTGRLVAQLELLFGRGRLLFIGELPCGYEDRPLIREWFKMGMRLVTSGFAVFLNADIIVPWAWLARGCAILRSLNLCNGLVYGTRTDVRVSPALKFVNVSSSSFLRDLESYCLTHARLNYVCGMDLVLVHSSFSALVWDELPDFVIGLCYWDVFFQGWANRRCQTVAVLFRPTIFHLDHLFHASSPDAFK